jgi:hypothetical protein
LAAAAGEVVAVVLPDAAAGELAADAAAEAEGAAVAAGAGGGAGGGVAGAGISSAVSSAETTAVRAGSAAAAAAAREVFGRVSRGSGSAGAAPSCSSPAPVGGLSTILMRERALFCGLGARDSVSRTMSCLGACVLPCRIAITVDSSSAAWGDFTSTPIDWSRKSTSLLPIPI